MILEIKQMSWNIRYVNVSSNCVNIEKSFLEFLNVNDTTGQGLLDVLLNELNDLEQKILIMSVVKVMTMVQIRNEKN